jgi:hypothetical protein
MAVGDRMLAADAHWVMGRVMPREFLGGVEETLDHVAPERKDELMGAIHARAEELVEEDKDMATDGPGRGGWRSVRSYWRRTSSSCRCSTETSGGRSFTSST